MWHSSCEKVCQPCMRARTMPPWEEEGKRKGSKGRRKNDEKRGRLLGCFFVDKGGKGLGERYFFFSNKSWQK